jgi:hypothetical protein
MLADGGVFPYGYLIVAADEWQEWAPGPKSVEEKPRILAPVNALHPIQNIVLALADNQLSVLRTDCASQFRALVLNRRFQMFNLLSYMCYGTWHNASPAVE